MVRRIIWFACLMIALLYSVQASAEREHYESWYQNIWCAANNGLTEVVLEDLTRCDCVTATHAIEFDFGDNWAEAIGQSLHYANLTGKKPGIVLIIETESDEKYWDRINTDIDHWHLAIDTWSDGDGMPLQLIQRQLPVCHTQEDVDQAVAIERNKWDVNSDGTIGIEEAIHAIQITSGIRSD